MTGAAWQKGFELEWLKALAEPFKVRHKPLVFGAFGLTKERDVAEALSRQAAVWTGKTPAVQAVALFTHNKRGSAQIDFTQREVEIPAGIPVVRAFAALSVEAGVKVIGSLMEQAERRLAVEIFEEDGIANACMKKCGLDYQFTKISAGSEIKGVYCSGSIADLLPAEEYATLRILKQGYVGKVAHDAILAELEGRDSAFAQHYSDYNKRKSWTSFALRGYSDDPGFIIKPSEMSMRWKEENKKLLAERPRWTKIAPQFPATVAVVESLGLQLDRVRFMRLRSKDGELSRHADITDREAGTRDGFVCRLHIPIRSSAAVRFFGWNARGSKLEMNLPERALCYLDQRKPHAVKNSDPSLDRIHLVIDCLADAKLRAKINAAAKPQARAA